MLVVATIVYWCGATAVAYDAYTGSLAYAQNLTAECGEESMGTYRRALCDEATRRGLLGTPLANRNHAFQEAGNALGLAAAIYAGISATLAALSWIVVGFRSSKLKPEP